MHIPHNPIGKSSESVFTQIKVISLHKEEGPSLDKSVSASSFASPTNVRNHRYFLKNYSGPLKLTNEPQLAIKKVKTHLIKDNNLNTPSRSFLSTFGKTFIRILQSPLEFMVGVMTSERYGRIPVSER